MMVGREVSSAWKSRRRSRARSCSPEDLVVVDDRGLEACRGVSLEVRAGEIVGIAGVDGNGQSELIDALTGLRRPASGRIVVGGKDVTNASARDVLDNGIGHIPGPAAARSRARLLARREPRPPRLPDAAGVSLRLAVPPPPGRAGAQAAERVRRARRRPQTPAAALSGGNQQKVVVAREVSRDPRVLVAAQPTRGLDVGAIEFVHRRLVTERDEGRAIMLVSFELEEILSLSDRILVVYEGRIVGEYPPDVSEEDLGFAMTGGVKDEAA